MDTNDLPIRKYAKDIVAAVQNNLVVVVIGETGSGKTTQISQILLDAGLSGQGKIGITQPRRVGAVTVARRVAEERQCDLGTEVGYAVRFEDRSCAETKIKYLTDGTLLRECLEDPLLSRYSIVVLDEAHERSLNTDILFGVMKRLVRKRDPPLKLVITSATLEGEKFSLYFDQCPVFHVPGRCFPVDIIHSKEDHLKNYTAAAIDTVMQVHMHQPPGDILVFLTGQAEIDNAVRRITEAVCSLAEGEAGELVVLPLYASLPPEVQLRVFQRPTGVRRCIVATNVAETSVTVEGVVYVIDSGVVKQKSYNPATGMDALDVVPISRVQATQRAGRAGRTRPGKCFRLYTAPFFEKQMPNVTLPEIQRTSLVGAVLYLKGLELGINVLAFDFLDPPETAALEDALRQLFVLDAIDVEGDITPAGRTMNLMPLDPALARALLAAHELGCLPEMLTVAAMLSAERIFSGGPKGEGEGGQKGQEQSEQDEMRRLLAEGLGDHILMLRLWQLWERAAFHRDFTKKYGLDLRGMHFAKEIRKQLEGIVGFDGRNLEPGGQPGSHAEVSEREEGERWRPAREEAGERPSKRPRRREDMSDAQRLDALRRALTVGFANRLARRMPRHNGYRTMNEAGQLAQLHPGSSHLAVDDDGLLPEWLVYHELVATSRPFLRQVCAIRGEWVEPLMPKLRGVDVKRLSRGLRRRDGTQAEEEGAEAGPDKDAAQEVIGKQQAPVTAAVPQRRNDDSTVNAARERYLQRKATKRK